MPKTPEHSTSRAALTAAAHLLALVESSDLPPALALQRVRGVIYNLKGLRDYQLDELVDFLEARAFGDLPEFASDDLDPDVSAAARDEARAARQKAAVDELIDDRQTTLDDIEPREAADALAARVRGAVTPPEGEDDADADD